MIDPSDIVASLLAWVLKQGGPCVVHAGHFMVDPSGCHPIASPQPPSSIKGTRREALWRAYGAFPSSSWHVGLELARELREKRVDVRLLTLANDWQLLRHALERGTAADRRAHFRKEHPRLPEAHQLAALALGFDPPPLLKLNAECDWVSETWLRRCFERRMRTKLRTGDCPEFAEECTRSGPTATTCRVDQNSYAVLTGGRAGCTGEIVELNLRLLAAGFFTLVNIVPTECSAHLEAGSRIAAGLFNASALRVVNAYVSWTDAASHAAWRRFQLKTHVYPEPETAPP